MKVLVDTERLVELCVNYEMISLEHAPLTEEEEFCLRQPIEQELSDKFYKFGQVVLYYASSNTAVAGMQDADVMLATGITDHPNLIGMRPQLHSVVYGNTELEQAGLVPSLVFETCESDIAEREGYSQGIVQLFPHAALPLIELHRIEAIGIRM